MIKVLYDHQCFANQQYGGISRYFTELINCFKTYQNISTNISINYSNNQYLDKINYEKIKPFFKEINFKGKVPILNFINKFNSIKNIKKNDFNIFHPTYYDPYFLKYLSSKPFVLTVHDMIHELYPDAVSKWDKSANYKKILVARAKKIICISNNTKNDLMKLLNVNEDKISVIYHSNSLQYKKDRNVEEQLSLPTKYLLYVGKRNYNYKNFTFMLNALLKLLKDDDELNLICAGGGKFSKKEIELFVQFGVANKLKSYNVNDEQLGALYSNALGFIYPSLYEGFGIPILEAFSCGCPVICSNRSSFPEIAENAAEYFEPIDELSIENAVKNVIYNFKRREELINIGYERLKNFSWVKSAEKTLSVYKECLEK
ncbi:MAG: glycosyltransferase family 1 protein [Ignavibacterium sp.]